MIYIPNDFVMDRTPQGYQWRQEDMSEIPRIRQPDGTIFEPFLRYFAYGWLNKRFKAKTSMEPDSYSLREYLCHATNLGLDWVAAGADDVLRSFRNSFADRVKDGELSSAQVELKLHHVFNFYMTIREAMPFINGTPMLRFVGKLGGIAPITSRQVGGKAHWSGWNKIDRRPAKRPTPNVDDVERILEHLRTAAMVPLDGTWKQSLRVFAAERNWLVACCAVRAGLRRKETASLSLRKIAEALGKLKIIEMPVGRWRSSVQANPLNEAVYDLRLRANIIAGIETYAARGYTTLCLDVQTKGKPERSVEFPLDLVLDLLEIGVWQVRKSLFERWTSEGKTDLDHDAIFLSSTRDGKRLTIKSVGDIVKDAFNNLLVAGSGHRLRAYYFTEMAWLLWNQELAKAGYRNDIAVNNVVLNRLADLAGHKRPGTMERHYLDRAILRHKMKANRPSLDARKDMMNALISVSWQLDEASCRRLQRVIYAFDDCKDENFFKVVDAAINKYVALKERPHLNKALHLRLVMSKTD